MNFNTTFELGYDIVYDRKLIAKNYIRTRFAVDIISAIPIDVIIKFLINSDAKVFKAFSLFKLVRMLRLSRIIRALNVKKEFKSKVKLMKLAFELILYLHCSSCLIWGLI